MKWKYSSRIDNKVINMSKDTKIIKNVFIDLNHDFYCLFILNKLHLKHILCQQYYITWLHMFRSIG